MVIERSRHTQKIKAIQTARIEEERQMLLSSRYVILQEIYDEYIRGLRAKDALVPNIADVALSTGPCNNHRRTN